MLFHDTATAGSALDGDGKNSKFDTRTCWHSADGGRPWWGVDLGVASTISHVVIYPRMDCCSISEDQSAQLQVRIGNNANALSAENKVCNANLVDAGKETRISCSGYAVLQAFGLR